ncbi:dars-2, partial [Pristionchus pacificus]
QFDRRSSMRLSSLLRAAGRSLLPVNSHVTRSHTCGELRLADAGSEVTLLGWLSFRRLNRFIVIRDSYGSIQATIREDDERAKSLLSHLPYESIVRVRGRVRDRGEQHRNGKMATGDVEIDVSSLEVVNEARRDMPLLPDARAHEQTRLTYRYIDLRSPQLQSNLRLRSSVIHAARRFLVEEKGFVDVETPTLFRRTPGGAAEFIVPTRTPAKGLAYSLPQSPQQFKQLLMVGGIDRYFQVARCYRDEGSKLDRQPEFTQLDIEVSFTTQTALLDLLEQVLLAAWPEHLNGVKPCAPFARLSFADAMRDYGVDKPDLRIPWKIEEVQSRTFERLRGDSKDSDWSLKCIVARGSASAVNKARVREWCRLVEMNYQSTSFAVLTAATKKKDGRWFNFVRDEEIEREFEMGEDDAVILAWGAPSKVQYTLGQLRGMVGEEVGLRRREEFRPLWVVDFPLFERDEEGSLVSCHHPFTAPVPEDEWRIEKEEGLEEIRAQHFDLVLNGVELGGGSIRIHNGPMQRRVLEILGEETGEMTHLLEALESGAPPHGGFAFGVDRLISILAGRGDTSYGIRDVIAFPKTKEGRDLMVDTPIEPSREELDRYGYEIAGKVEKK